MARRVRRRRRLSPRRAARRIRRGLRGLGRYMSWKSIIAGVATLWVMKKLIGENSLTGFSVGNYDPAVQKIATGFVDQAVGMDNADMISVGIKEGVATLLDNLSAGVGFGRGGVVESL
ncbi:MAG: hypothetical protein QW186_08780 [Candidatus Bathyarchaeia archaeon]